MSTGQTLSLELETEAETEAGDQVADYKSRVPEKEREMKDDAQRAALLQLKKLLKLSTDDPHDNKPAISEKRNNESRSMGVFQLMEEAKENVEREDAVTVQTKEELPTTESTDSKRQTVPMYSQQLYIDFKSRKQHRNRSTFHEPRNGRSPPRDGASLSSGHQFSTQKEEHSRDQHYRREGASFSEHTPQRSRRELLVADGTIGYGGSEMQEDAYDFASAPSNKKYKWEVLWKSFPSQVRQQLFLDQVSFFSVTDYCSAELISEALMCPEMNGADMNHCKRIMVDATACVGGNSFSFIKSFEKTYAIELDHKRAGLLRHNLGIVSAHYKSQSSSVQNAELALESTLNYKVVVGDCMEKIPLLPELCPRAGARTGERARVQVIFFDPPWGGKEYRHRGQIRLFLSNLSIGEVCAKLAPWTMYFAIKIPASNINESEIVEQSECAFVKVVPIGSKMKLLILRTKC